MRTALQFALLTALLAVSALASTRGPRHDPLNDREIDEIREAAQNANQRITLYIKFTQARLDAIEQLRSDPKQVEGRGQRIHDLLEDFNTLVNEINDNVDQYNQQHEDLRKPLPKLVAAVTSWQTHIQAIKDAGQKDDPDAVESRSYYFILDTTIETLNDCLKDAHDTLAEQLIEQSKKKK